MRALHRHTLSRSLVKKLNGLQENAKASTIRAYWKAERQKRTMRSIESELLRITGRRGRCMYCGDSYGGDIDHFWPQASFVERAFEWSNLLWVCQPCNRQKGLKFPLTDQEEPLFIDPTAIEPWTLFVYECGKKPLFDKKGAVLQDEIT